MAAKNVRLKSNFKVCRDVADDLKTKAIKEGTEAMDAEASKRISRAADVRGYELDVADLETDVSDDEGVLRHTKFYWRWFEFGTVYIAPVPALGPGHRKGRKKVKEVLGDDFEKWIRRRARVR